MTTPFISYGATWGYPVAGNTTIREYQAVGVDASGNAVPLATGANQRFLGVSTEYVSTAGLAAGAENVTVLKGGVVLARLASGSGLTAGSVGAPVYFDGHHTSGLPIVHGTATNRTQIGTLVRIQDANHAIIRLANVV